MSGRRHATFYLEDGLRQSAEAGRHNFLSLISEVLGKSGFSVSYRPDSEVERAVSANRDGYAIFHMAEPTHDRAVTLRRVYHYPFWAIERSARRWEWEVARSRFDPEAVPKPEARRFYRFWRKRLFGDRPDRAGREGFVYVPLQGRLLEQRSFQSCAPVDMLCAVLAAEHRPVVAALHPKEVYSEEERRVLDDLAHDHPRLEIRLGGMEPLLQGCDYVVTENSSAAFNGYFFGKPAVLFARSDFSHIALDATRMGADAALAAAPAHRPDYAAYLHWFWQQMSINAGRPEAGEKIAARLRAAGWPV
ncbi:hypothetical protein [Pseudodonghicola xiamenensis]|uniref:Capsule polysaccharide biosynthesis protein n=1 Tax=Pseudodonghicola xiamenensis TaxID=337702 RepID=A0A8J3H5V5_9RHOB|nr:hypothetical protein [Pseudodonghicola xiamenensis]GHG83073.1 hypothetical protein GCM10010961_08140 [Pseudodonghicola xiamenensis]